MNNSLRLIGALCAASVVCCATETRTWSQNDYADFEKGDLKRLSVSSDGKLRLAPLFREVLDSSSVYLWAMAEDSRGNLYAGGGGPGGSGARVYVVPPKGTGKEFGALDDLEVHALAVDRNDRLYAATSPDGKVYRFSPDGKAQVFFDPKAKYIWGMTFGPDGALYIATGDHGEVYRVTPDGKGTVFYKTAETHARSIAVDGSGNLIVGTEPNGLIIRVSPKGEGFVLYQAAKREVTAVAVAKNGSIYAAAVGTRTASAGLGLGLGGPRGAVAETPTPLAGPAPQAPAPGGQAAGRPALPAGAPAPLPPAPIAGGSEVYRIDKDGFPRKVWSHQQHIAYAIGFDAEQRPLVGTGNKGLIYRLDSDLVYTELLNAPPTQVTALYSGQGGRIYAATGNVGKVYQIGPGLEKEGSIESDVFDAGMFSYWGRLSFRGQVNGGGIAVATRTGNLDRPQNDWSPWSSEITTPEGGRVASPPARFVQWKAVLRASSSGNSPELHWVDVAYLARNVAPEVQVVEITPPNYRFPPQAQLVISTPTPISLPPIGKPARPTPSLSSDSGAASMQYAKGYVGARWLAMDDNGDPLSFTTEIRGETETEWKPLKEKLTDKHFSWDSAAYPDGEYRIRVIASDAPGNTPETTLRGELMSDPFIIDNTPPVITGLGATASGAKVVIRWKAADALSNIVKTEYSVDGGEWTLVDPVTKLSDSKTEEYALTLDGGKNGEQTVAVRVTDEFDNTAVAKVVVK